jgi:hypothetical protein
VLGGCYQHVAIGRQYFIVFAGGGNDLLPLFEIADLKSLHVRLQEVNPDPNWYSNPQNIVPFPFPFIYNQLLIDRFHLSDPPESVFEYMGWGCFWKCGTRLAD